MKYLKQKEKVYFYFYDDFDYMQVQSIKIEVQEILKEMDIKTVFFDFENVTFIDSTGIGFVLARYRELSKRKIEIILCNLSKENKVIFEMSGLFQIIKHQKNEVKL